MAATRGGAAGGGGKSAKGESAAGGNPITFDQGKRQMKQFPLTESELVSIGNTSAASTFCFSFGGALFGFGINLHKDLAIAQGVPADQIAIAGSVKAVCLVVGLCFLIAGAGLFLYGRRTLDEIKSQTTFSNSPQYVIPAWPGIALRIAGVILLMMIGAAIGLLFR